MAGLAEIQKHKVRLEEKRTDVEKFLQKDLEELDQHTEDSIDLLKFAYKRFPPKNPKHVLAAGYDKNIKKALCQAIRHYHPDKIIV